MAERGLNQVSLIGRLGKDAEQRWTQSGKSVSNFSLAIGESFKGADGQWQDKTEWVNCVLWGSEGVVPYLTKGTKIYALGKIQTRKWEAKDGGTRYTTEVNCQSVILLGDGGGNGQQEGRSGPPQQQQRRSPQQRPPARRQPPARATEEDYGDQDYDKDSVPF